MLHGKPRVRDAPPEFFPVAAGIQVETQARIGPGRLRSSTLLPTPSPLTHVRHHHGNHHHGHFGPPSPGATHLRRDPASVKLLQSAGKVTPTTRFVSVSLKEPDKEAVHGFDGTATSPREAFAVLFDNATNSCYEADRLADRTKLLVLEARPRRAADDDHRRAGRVRAGRARQPGVQGRPQEALRHRRHQPGHGRHLERRQLRRGGGRHAAAGPAALLPPHRPDRQRLRPADRGAAAGRRPEHDAGDPRRGVRPLAAAARARQLRRRPRPELPRPTSSRWRSPSRTGRASRSRATRCAGRSGASSSASTPAKG